MINFKRKLMLGSLAAVLTLGGLTGCGDGVDQDNGINDGEMNDENDDKNEEEG